MESQHESPARVYRSAGLCYCKLTPLCSG